MYSEGKSLQLQKFLIRWLVINVEEQLLEQELAPFYKQNSQFDVYKEEEGLSELIAFKCNKEWVQDTDVPWCSKVSRRAIILRYH